MTKSFILACLLVCTTSAYSQSISSYLISNAGTTESTNNATISWSLGEPVISSTGHHQGYHFKSEIQNLLTAIEERFQISLKFFPNPVSDVLNIEFSDPSSKINIQVLNSKGQKIKTAVLEKDNLIQLNFRDLNSGIYLVKVSQHHKSMSHKIIKE